MTRIKVCGITCKEDALAALKCGVNMLGFNFYSKSPRYVSPEKVRQIVRNVPADVWKVGVFVNHKRPEIVEIAGISGIDTLQFHGDENQEMVSDWEGYRVIKAFRIGPESAPSDLGQYVKLVDYILLDARDEQLYGGSGKLIAKSALLPFLQNGIMKKVFLAGGLKPENVKERIQQFRPFAVDVASGVEDPNGRKNIRLMGDFTKAVKEIKLLG